MAGHLVILYSQSGFQPDDSDVSRKNTDELSTTSYYLLRISHQWKGEVHSVHCSHSTNWLIATLRNCLLSAAYRSSSAINKPSPARTRLTRWVWGIYHLFLLQVIDYYMYEMHNTKKRWVDIGVASLWRYLQMICDITDSSFWYLVRHLWYWIIHVLVFWYW